MRAQSRWQGIRAGGAGRRPAKGPERAETAQPRCRWRRLRGAEWADTMGSQRLRRRVSNPED